MTTQTTEDCQSYGHRSDEYNGWTNRETWALALHLSNNQGDYEAAVEQAEALVQRDTGNQDTRQSELDMASWIKEWADEASESVFYPEYGAPTQEARMLVSDVGSFWRVDYDEIAVGYIHEASEAIRV